MSRLFSIGKRYGVLHNKWMLCIPKRERIKTPGDSENLLCHIREKLECGETSRRFNVCSEHGVSQDQERCLRKRGEGFQAERREVLIMSKSKNRWFVRILLILKTLLKRANGFQQIQSAAKQRHGTASVIQAKLGLDFL